MDELEEVFRDRVPESLEKVIKTGQDLMATLV